MEEIDSFDMQQEEILYPTTEECDGDMPYPGEDMDGDATSALASAGWGTDEDYGSFDGEDF